MKKMCVFLSVLLFAISCSTGNVFSLKVGQCFADEISSEEVENVDIVDCEEPHLNEIYAVRELPITARQISSIFIDEASAEICLNAFKPFVGQDYEYSIYEVGWLRPSKEAWEQLDDREVVCFLFDIRGQLKTGTAANSGM